MVDSITNSTASATSTAQLGGKSYVDQKNMFLQMLVTQMKNQDPFAPQDSNAFSQQMMSMGQLEQMMSINEGIGNMATSQQSGMISQYSNLVGKNVVADGNSLQISSESKGVMQFSLPESPKSVKINVFDARGNLVRILDTPITSSGTHDFAFDGKNSQGQNLPHGYYSYTVDAVNALGKTVVAETSSIGKISSVKLSNGTPIFEMGDMEFGLSNVKRIF